MWQDAVLPLVNWLKQTNGSIVTWDVDSQIEGSYSNNDGEL